MLMAVSTGVLEQQLAVLAGAAPPVTHLSPIRTGEAPNSAYEEDSSRSGKRQASSRGLNFRHLQSTSWTVVNE